MKKLFCLIAVGLGVAIAAAAPATREALAPQVPIENDRELFAAFDLNRPELATVKAAVGASDFVKAKAALLAYYRQRRAPVWFENWWQRPAQSTNVPPAALLENAEKILAHQFAVAGASAKFGGTIDWRYLPARLPDGSPDYQFPLVLYINRVTWWRDVLGPAYWATGDERFAREWAAEVEDWTRRNPAPTVFDENVAPVPWRRLTAAHSIPMWISGLNYFLQSDAVTPNTFAAFMKGVIQKTRYTIRNPETVNRLLVQLEAVHAAATYFPELRDAARWRQWALDEIERFIDEEIYPDGSSKELTPGYQTVVIGSLRGVIALADANAAPVHYAIRDALARASEYVAAIMLPDGTVPAFGDTWAPAFVAPDLQSALPFYPPEKGRPRLEQLRYVATLGTEGQPPPSASTAAPWAGFYVMRAGAKTNTTSRANAAKPVGPGWHFGDVGLAFDAGPFGTDHQHEDKLSFVLYAFGARLIDAMGVYHYGANSWHDWFASTAAHNALLVDGLGQNRRAKPATWTTSRPLENNWAGDDAFDFVSGIYEDGWGPKNVNTVTQRRQIFFAKPDYWIVQDLLTGSGTHTYETLYHLQPANSVQVHDLTKVIYTDNLRRPNLVIYPVDADIEVEIKRGWSVNPTDPQSPRQGWFSPGLQKVEPAPCAIQRRRGPAPQVMESILLPALPNDTADVSAERLTATDGTGKPFDRTEVTALRIITRAGTDIYVNDLRVDSLQDQGSRPKKIQAGKFGTVQFDGKLLFIRLSTINEPLLVRHVGGQPPTRGGHEILAAPR